MKWSPTEFHKNVLIFHVIKGATQDNMVKPRRAFIFKESRLKRINK
jgi:hypothetical protein